MNLGKLQTLVSMELDDAQLEEAIFRYCMDNQSFAGAIHDEATTYKISLTTSRWDNPGVACRVEVYRSAVNHAERNE